MDRAVGFFEFSASLTHWAKNGACYTQNDFSSLKYSSSPKNLIDNNFVKYLPLEP